MFTPQEKAEIRTLFADTFLIDECVIVHATITQDIETGGMVESEYRETVRCQIEPLSAGENNRKAERIVGDFMRDEIGFRVYVDEDVMVDNTDKIEYTWPGQQTAKVMPVTGVFEPDTNQILKQIVCMEVRR